MLTGKENVIIDSTLSFHRLCTRERAWDSRGNAGFRPFDARNVSTIEGCEKDTSNHFRVLTGKENIIVDSTLSFHRLCTRGRARDSRGNAVFVHVSRLRKFVKKNLCIKVDEPDTAHDSPPPSARRFLPQRAVECATTANLRCLAHVLNAASLTFSRADVLVLTW